MKHYRYFIFLIVYISFINKALCQKSTLRFLLNNKSKLFNYQINPAELSIDCYEIDTCTVIYKFDTIVFVKNTIENKKEIVLINRKLTEAIPIINKQEKLVDSRYFLDYLFCEYYSYKSNFIIISTIPFCTGIACKSRIIKIINKNKLWEVLIKWDD